MTKKVVFHNQWEKCGVFSFLLEITLDTEWKCIEIAWLWWRIEIRY